MCRLTCAAQAGHAAGYILSSQQDHLPTDGWACRGRSKAPGLLQEQRVALHVSSLAAVMVWATFSRNAACDTAPGVGQLQPEFSGTSAVAAP